MNGQSQFWSAGRGQSFRNPKSETRTRPQTAIFFGFRHSAFLLAALARVAAGRPSDFGFRIRAVQLFSFEVVLGFFSFLALPPCFIAPEDVFSPPGELLESPPEEAAGAASFWLPLCICHAIISDVKPAPLEIRPAPP